MNNHFELKFFLNQHCILTAAKTLQQREREKPTEELWSKEQGKKEHMKQWGGWG